jgi:acetylglutamate kinase
MTEVGENPELTGPEQPVRTQRDVVTLLEALPYIREFHGRTVVIKYGGAAMTDPTLKQEFARDITLLKYVGINPVIVHGGGPEITAYMERLNMPVKFVDGLRVSDAETVKLAKMVLVGKVNKDIVLLINRHGQPAVGLSGDDGRLFHCSRLAAPSGQDIGFVGRIDHVDTGVLTHVGSDYIPVIASVGADEHGNSYNINADDAAAAVAAALGAYKAMFLTDVAGWFRAPGDPGTLVAEATATELREALAGVGGGMRPKLAACLHAVEGGVPSAVIVDGRVPHSLLLELFTNEGQGTMIVPDPAHDPGPEPAERA